MKTNQFIYSYTLMGLIIFLLIGWQKQSAIALILQKTAGPTAKASKDQQPSGIQSEAEPRSNQPLPKISFEKTVCDLGDVGQGTKNT